MLNFNKSVCDLNRVGKSTTKQLEKIGIKTAEDLLFHYPFRYDDYRKVISVAELKTKRSGTIKVKISLISTHRSPKKRMSITEAVVSDQSDSLKVIWFNQPFLTKLLKSGQEIYLAGKIETDDYYGLQLVNPSHELCQNRDQIHTGRLIPIYPTTNRLSQKQLRFLIHQILSSAQDINDWLPRDIRTDHNLISLGFALRQIHFPENKDWLEKAVHRLKFDELFLIQLKNYLVRQKIKTQPAALIEFKLEQTQEFVKNLPFKLIDAQRKASWEIINDLGKGSPMNRLLEGDVGSGKTVVAVIAILNVLLNNYQVAYMAPTEILAEQHFKNISNLLSKYRFKVALLTRSSAKTNKNENCKKSEIVKNLFSRKIDLVVGTHALIQEKIKFKNLGLAIVDEQHRFGVEQRAKIMQLSPENNLSPHFLSLSATPIPRSVALTLYGDLDLSIIDQLPLGRKKIITKIVGSKEKKEVYNFIRAEIKNGRQAFIICPLIDPSDKLGVKSVKEEYKKISEEIFPEFKIGLLHGRLKTNEKEKIMFDFSSLNNQSPNKNKIDILISTTVVEVGIDIPNASIMIIEGAERFGLAQLYQLRGRIGRDQYQSHCFLFFEETAGVSSEKTKKRLEALLSAKNGFELAEKDLELRGPGELFGTGQSGFLADLKIAKLSDLEIIKQAQQTIRKFFSQINNLDNYPLLKKKIGETITTTHFE